MLAREAFRDDDVVSLSEQFVCILVDINKEWKTAAGFRINGTPTVSLMLPTAGTERRMTGLVSAEALLEEMQKALKMANAQASKKRI